MADIVNKIRLNNALWFTILGNKIVFGDSNSDTSCHYTISFGNRTGYFDLHMTGDKSKEHFTIFEISHLNVAEHLPHIFNKIVRSVLDLDIISEEKLKTQETTIYQFSDNNDILHEFSSLVKKDKIVIDKDSKEFKELVDRLVSSSRTTTLSLGELKKINQFTGFIKTGTDIELIMKNEFIGSEIYALKNIDLDINSVIEKIFGVETYRTIVERIDEGIRALTPKQ